MKQKLLLLFFFLLPSISLAEVHFCNESRAEKVFVSYAIQGTDGWKVKGWFAALPGRCVTYNNDPKGAYLYYLAHTEKKTQSWEGSKTLCASPGSFGFVLERLSGFDCAALGLVKEKYREVRIKKAKQIKILLAPNHGGSQKATPYSEARESQLQEWAGRGDKNATAELQLRQQGERANEREQSQIQESDLQEKDPEPKEDEGAFWTL